MQKTSWITKARITKALIAGVCAACFHAPAFALDDPISTRQDIMKNVGSATKVLGQMVKGQMDYSPVVAEQALRSMASSSAAFIHYFPEGSETGGDTEALPAIWQNKADFDAIAARMAAASFAGIEGAKANLDGLKAAFGPVVQNCKACHQDFRQAN